MPRKTKTGSDCSILNGDFYYEDARQFSIESEMFAEEIEGDSVKSIRVISLASNWKQYTYVGMVEIEEMIDFEMTLRKEKRGQKNHWYAYRRFAGKLFKRYVGRSESVTQSRLIEIARALPARTKTIKVS